MSIAIQTHEGECGAGGCENGVLREQYVALGLLKIRQNWFHTYRTNTSEKSSNLYVPVPFQENSQESVRLDNCAAHGVCRTCHCPICLTIYYGTLFGVNPTKIDYLPAKIYLFTTIYILQASGNLIVDSRRWQNYRYWSYKGRIVSHSRTG